MQAPRTASSPSHRALQAARSASMRAGGSAAIRLQFIARTLPDDPPPLMAELLRGGRSGEVRLKLYLSLLWFGRNIPDLRVAYPAQSWAELLDLPNPATAGARRIQEGLRWLEKKNLVRLERRPGEATAIHLLDDTGSGEPYEPAGQAVNRLRGHPDQSRHIYVQLPSSFWTSGWICVLSGAAVAMYLAVLHEQGPADDSRQVWFSPAIARSRFDLSDDTRSKGLTELTRAGLISTSRRPVGLGPFDDNRYRNVYTINPAALSQHATVPPPPPRRPDLEAAFS